MRGPNVSFDLAGVPVVGRAADVGAGARAEQGLGGQQEAGLARLGRQLCGYLVAIRPDTGIPSKIREFP